MDRTEDLIHDGMDLCCVVKYQHNMSEDDRTVSTKHSLGTDQAFLACDLMWDALRKSILDMPDGSLPAVHQRTNNENRVHRWLS